MLFDTVCKLVDNFDGFMSRMSSSRWSNSFKIITNIPYPTKAYKNDEANFDAVYLQAVSDISTISTHHIGVIKEFYSDRINFRVVMNLPDTGPLEGLDGGIKETLRSNIESAMNAYYIVYRSSALAEIAGYSILMKFIVDLENNSLDYFGMMGFIDIPYDGESITKTSETFTNLTSGKNYGGIKLDGIDINNFLSFSDVEGTSFSYIISSKNDITKINEMGNNFSNLSSKIKIWIHFDFILPEDLPALRGNKSGSRNGSSGIMKVKFENNFSEAEADAILQSNYNKKVKLANCSFPNENFADNCIVPKGQEFFGSDPAANFLTGLTAGFIGEIFNYIHFVYSSAQKIDANLLLKWGVTVFKFTTIYQSLNLGANLAYAIRDTEAFRKKMKQTYKEFVRSVDEIIDIGVSVFKTLSSIDTNKLREICIQAKEAFMFWLNGIIENATLASASLLVGKLVGSVGFEIAIAALGGAALKAAKMSTEFLSFYKLLNKKDGVKNWLIEKLKAAPSWNRMKCAILGKGCFIKDTPVLMAGNPFRNTTVACAMASLPIVSVPIQDLQLFDYAVAHKSVNASYGLTASTDDTYILNKDPYTSDQQSSRDQYEINDTDWSEVTFEQVLGSSKCKLALHQEWIAQNNYTVEAVVNMNLPEQGISGPFKITSIRHILPQKEPKDEDSNDDYEYKPVTGLFIHQSYQVYNISFDNNETIGVTSPHPIYSTTYNGWRLAGELEVGEKVLTYHGEATVSRTEKKAGSEAVYNLEVKDLHNFFVGELGVVVHNSCSKLLQIKNKYPNDPIPNGKSFNFNIENGKLNIDNHQGRTEFDFIIDNDGKLKIGDKHLFLSQKANVQGAGKIKVINGEVRRIDNLSGHYQPSPDETELFEDFFRAGNNLNLSKAALEVYGFNDKGTWTKLSQRYLK
jgi:Pretoxin HINT domain